MDGTVDGAHVYADDGTYTVTVCVTDDDGGTGCDSFTVTVENSDPVVEAGPDQSAAEGDEVTVAATYSDAGLFDNVRC